MKFKILVLIVFSFFSMNLNAAPVKPLQIAVVQEWDTFHPVSFGTASSEAFIHFFQRNMVFRDAAGKVLPEIAVEVPSLKNKKVKIINIGGKKKVQAVWQIRPEVVWGDETPMTCADWKFAWQVGMNDNVSKSEKGLYSKIEKIEWNEKQNKKCTVTYVNDEWTFDRDLPPFLPLHIEGKIFDQYKNKSQAYEQNSTYQKNPSNPGLYNGPYLIEEMKVGSHVLLKANPKYWGAKPKIEKIYIKYIADTNALRPNLESHQIDMVSAVGYPPDLAISMSEENAKNFKVRFISSPLYQGLFFNLESELSKEDSVRIAIAMAVNKDELTQAFFKGKLHPAYTILSETDKAFRDFKKKSDSNGARKLLDDAGWKIGVDGIRAKSGKKLSLEFRTSAGIRVLETIQTYICSEIRKINIECSAKNQPPRIFLGDSLPKGDFVMGMFGQSTYLDASLRGMFHSNDIPSEKNSWAGGNVIRLKSPKMDQLLVAFDSEWDGNKRKTILQGIDQMVRDKAWIIPIYHRREAVVLPKTLQGFTDDMKGTTFVYPEHWVF